MRFPLHFKTFSGSTLLELLQVSKWPCNPIDEVIKTLLPICNDKKLVIADMGCGVAKLAQALGDQAVVHSFDFIALHPCVVQCEMSQVS